MSIEIPQEPKYELVITPECEESLANFGNVETIRNALEPIFELIRCAPLVYGRYQGTMPIPYWGPVKVRAGLLDFLPALSIYIDVDTNNMIVTVLRVKESTPSNSH